MRSPLARVRLGFARDITLGTFLERLAGLYDRRVLVEEASVGRILTYRDAAAEVDRWAGAIRDRISSGDRVVLATPNYYDQLLLSLAVCRADGIAVPVNPRMRDEEIDHVIADAGAELVVHDPTDLGAGQPLGQACKADPREIAALFYTSGTTGSPKGVELTHRGLLGELVKGALLPTELLRAEAVVGLPIAHIMGFSALLGFAAMGLRAYFLERFRPDEVLDALEQRRSAMFIGVPAMYRMLLDAGAERRDLKSVRVWMSGADAMPRELAHRFQRLGASAELPGIGPIGEALFVEGYGMAELAGGVAGRVDLPGPGRRLFGGALGLPLPGYHLKVVGDDGRPIRHGRVGELWVKGPGVTLGYWGNPEASAELLTPDGWVRTGDLARRGLLGTVSFAGRVKDVVKHGGYSVYAVEVEQVLQRHPAVAEAAVLGLPDERFGEVPVAAVRLKPAATATAEEIVAFGREHLADYKAPRRVAFVDEFPRTGSQKVQKRELRTLFA